MRGNAIALLLLAGCGGAHHHAPAPKLVGRHRCADAPAFDCATLVRGGRRLAVALQRRPGRVLIYLTGGPGQGGVSFAKVVGQRLGRAAPGYRIVLIDQRGTGSRPLRCPALQRQMGFSDLTRPTVAAVADCARRIPDRADYATADTVADLDALRQTLGVRTVAIDGVSYGTFVAERYALAHPGHVDRLVLDSVVPQAGGDMLQRANIAAVPRVLRDVCGRCVRRLGAAARAVGGPELLDALVTLSVADPTYRGVVAGLRSPARLRRLLADVRRGDRGAADQLSQGLHAATLCADSVAPWGGPGASFAARAQALTRVHVDSPLGDAAARDNGWTRTCRYWPPERIDQPDGSGQLPPVPVLLLAGTHDLSTPLAWAREELTHAPRGHLVVVPGAGHSVQGRAVDPAGRRAVGRFFRASR